MQRPSLLPPELRAFVSSRYLEADLPPRLITAELNTKFGTTYKSPQIRQWITRSGLAKRKDQLDQKVCAIVSSATVNTIARAKAAEPEEHLKRWAEKTVTIADKALDTAASSGRLRDVATATAAANTAIRLYRLVAGIETERPAAAMTFNYNFANVMPRRIGAPVPAAIEVIVQPVSESSQ